MGARPQTPEIYRIGPLTEWFLKEPELIRWDQPRIPVDQHRLQDFSFALDSFRRGSDWRILIERQVLQNLPESWH